MISLPIYISFYLFSLLLFAFIIVKFVKPSTKNPNSLLTRGVDEEGMMCSKAKMCNCSRNQNATNLGWKLLCEKLSDEKMMLLHEANDLRRINYELKIIIQGYDETLETIGLG